jgi:hypothetical protein
LYGVERFRLEAQTMGWAVRHGILDPATVPVMWHGRWVLLDHDGGVKDITVPPPLQVDGGTG